MKTNLNLQDKKKNFTKKFNNAFLSFFFLIKKFNNFFNYLTRVMDRSHKKTNNYSKCILKVCLGFAYFAEIKNFLLKIKVKVS